MVKLTDSCSVLGVYDKSNTALQPTDLGLPFSNFVVSELVLLPVLPEQVILRLLDMDKSFGMKLSSLKLQVVHVYIALS